MKRIQLSPHFYLDELVPRETYEKYGPRSIWFVRPQIVEVAEYLRVVTGKPITINNWLAGGQYNYSGYRPPSCKIGGKESQHRFGNAIDPKVKDLTPPEVLEIVERHWPNLNRLGLTTMEDVAFTKTWNHLDCRVTGEEKLFIVKP